MAWLAMPTVGKFESLHGISPTVEPPEKTAMRTPFHHKRLLATRLAQTDDQLRAKALRRLRDLILVAPSQSQLGRALLDSSGHFQKFLQMPLEGGPLPLWSRDRWITTQ